MLFLKQVFTLFKVEKVLSGVLVDTGSVHKIFNEINIFDHFLYHLSFTGTKLHILCVPFERHV